MGWSFLRTLQIQGHRKLGVVGTRSESRTGFYTLPIHVGDQGLGLLTSSGLPALQWHQKLPLPPLAPKPRQHVPSSWPEVSMQSCGHGSPESCLKVDEPWCAVKGGGT